MEDLDVEIFVAMILMTGMLDETSVNVLDMYHLITYKIGLKQKHDDAWKEVKMLMSIQ